MSLCLQSACQAEAQAITAHRAGQRCTTPATTAALHEGAAELFDEASRALKANAGKRLIGNSFGCVCAPMTKKLLHQHDLWLHTHTVQAISYCHATYQRLWLLARRSQRSGNFLGFHLAPNLAQKTSGLAPNLAP